MKKRLRIKLKEELKNLAKRLNLKDLSEALYFPKYFEVETIRACNAKCKMCTIHEWKNKNNRMTDNLFYKIAEEMSNYNQWINRVCLSRNGEPLLDKTLEQKIRKLKDYGIKEVSFSTNASILNEKRSVSLIESGLDDIRFSIDGITKKTFEYIRGGLDYEQVKNNCLKFIQLRNQYGKKPKIHIRMTLQDANKHEEKEWKDYWVLRILESDIVSSKPMHSWGNQLKNYEKTKQDKEDSLPCISPFSTMIIHFNGKVPLCGCDYNNEIILGKVSKESIKKIWQGTKYQEIRKIHETKGRNEIPLCVGCNIWDVAGKKEYKGEK